MDFIPDQPSQSKDVPYFDNVTSEGGWQGHSTSKSIETLKAEVVAAIGRLGGIVTGFQQGRFTIGAKTRDGFRVHYAIERPNGVMIPGRMDVAALPVKDDYRRKRSYDSRRQKSLKMALYMLRQALNGTWFLQQLSPGYSALMPWMLDQSSKKTITQLWSDHLTIGNLLPSGDDDILDGEFEELHT